MRNATWLKGLVLGLVISGSASLAHAGGPLLYCGYHSLDLVMQEVPTDWWNYGINESCMWTYNQYMDVYRVTPSDGSWGRNFSNEFAGWPSDADLNSQWGFHWNGALAITCFWWFCECCQLQESDVAFNPAYTWTSDKLYAEDNPGVIFYTSTLMHELGHTWGEQTKNETYDYDVPSVMHAYYVDTVQSDYTLHAPDAYLIRRDYDDQKGVPNIQDMGVFSVYPGNGLHNTYTDFATYAPGDVITVHGITVENTSNQALANVHIRIYLSTNRTISTSDTLIGDWSWSSFPAEAWGAYDLTTSVPLTLANGTYHVGAIITQDGYAGDAMPWNDTTRLYGAINIDYQCSDDGREPNDAWWQASTVSEGSYFGLQVCRFDEDWFRVWVNAEQDLDATIRFTNAAGDLDLYLYDPNLNLIDQSTGAGSEEHVRVSNAPAAGYYYVQAVGFQGADNVYSLHVALSDCGVHFTTFGQGLAGKGGRIPNLTGTDGGCDAGSHTVHIANGLGGASGVLFVGFQSGDLFPFYGGHFYIDFSSAWQVFGIKLQGAPGVAGAGFLDIPGQNVNAYTGITLYLQAMFIDPAAIRGFSFTNGLTIDIGY